MGKIFLFIMLQAGQLTALDLGRIVEDSDFVYQEIHRKYMIQFLKSFPNNRFTGEQTELIADECSKGNVSILWALARIQTEQGLVANIDDWNYASRIERCFSYGFGTHSNQFRGFTNQVTNAIRRMRELAGEWKPGKITPVKDHGNVACATLATYVLHRYNWVWDAASNFGVYNLGNVLFVRILRDFESRFEKVSKKSRVQN